MKPELLVLIALRGEAHREIAASFDVRHAPTAARASPLPTSTAFRGSRS
jgi:hypothetical protein